MLFELDLFMSVVLEWCICMLACVSLAGKHPANPRSLDKAINCCFSSKFHSNFKSKTKEQMKKISKILKKTST